MMKFYLSTLIIFTSLILFAQEIDIQQFPELDAVYILHATDEFHIFKQDTSLVRIFEVGEISIDTKSGLDEVWYRLYISIMDFSVGRKVFVISALDNPDKFVWDSKGKVLSLMYFDHINRPKELNLQFSKAGLKIID